MFAPVIRFLWLFTFLYTVVSSTVIIAAPYTPFYPNTTVNYNVIPLLAQSLVSQSVDGAFLCGTTGESLSLTIEERKAIATTWKQTVTAQKLPLQIIVHVGAESLSDAIALAQHAAAIGITTIATMPPTFF
eukprot:PhF_6_TR10980/c0_g1_i2/m.17743/K01639/E4.1.3.3, nanA, NPL; N-acetylneuraminate lyase